MNVASITWKIGRDAKISLYMNMVKFDSDTHHELQNLSLQPILQFVALGYYYLLSDTSIQSSGIWTQKDAKHI